jgi:hypothetical protein
MPANPTNGRPTVASIHYDNIDSGYLWVNAV